MLEASTSGSRERTRCREADVEKGRKEEAKKQRGSNKL